MSPQPPIWPEPLRDAFGSDEEHAHAWMRWAEHTPGGWRARWAERTGGPVGGRPIPIRLDGDADGAVTVPVNRAEPVEPRRGAPASSSCCAAVVILDPFVATERRGLCGACGAVLDRTDAGWHPPA